MNNFDAVEMLKRRPQLNLVIDGRPVPQPRQRHRVAGAFAMSYTPRTHPVTAYKKHLALVAAMGVRGKAGWNHSGPFFLDVEFTFKRPKSHFRANGVQLHDRAPIYHTQTPDLDNLVKAVKDALTTGGIWKDDSQVVSESTSKRWDTKEFIVITVYEYRLTALLGQPLTK